MAELPGHIFDIFGFESGRGGRPQQNVDDYPMITDICRLNEFGEHVYIGRKCPHTRVEDEFGEIQPEGWTVQW